MKPRFADAAKKDFAERLLAWFASAMRPFPWRERYDPYCVWISEIMLQQTQAERGVACYRKWMERFPDVRSVAEAREEEILAAWEGLGYYRRAKNLHAAAKRIMAEHGGKFPDALEAIRALPGVGEYTAGAVAAIAFNTPVPAVDANVARIFSRILDLDAPAAAGETRAAATAAAAELMPAGSARLFNQALMELGALVCGRNPKCAVCPVREHCAALAAGTVALRPAKGEGGGRRLVETAAGVVVRDGLVFIRRRPPDGLWGGLWEFPGGRVRPDEDPESAAARYVGEAIGRPASAREKIGVFRHGYTVHRVTMHGYFCDIEAGPSSPPGAPDGEWIRLEEIGRRAFPAGDRKLLELLGWKRKAEP